MTDSGNTGNANGMKMFFNEVTTGVSGMSQNESGMAEKKKSFGTLNGTCSIRNISFCK